MNLNMDHKKLSYIFYGVGVLIIISLLLAIGGNQSAAALTGNFLFQSFSFPSFYLPFFLLFYGYLIFHQKLTVERIILLTFTVIPFLTISLMFRVFLSHEGSLLSESLITSFGRSRSLVFLSILSGLEIFLLYILPGLFFGNEEKVDDPDSETLKKDSDREEESAFRDYAFKFPDPEEDAFKENKTFENNESIDDIFTSILSGGQADVPPPHPTIIEPVKEVDPFESLESPFIENDPAIAVLTGDKEVFTDDLPDEISELGDYTYHKHKEYGESDEAAEKITEIMAELDSVLSDSVQEVTEETSKQIEVEDEYADGYIADKFDELDEFRNLSGKQTPEENITKSINEESVDRDNTDKIDNPDEFGDISNKLAPLESDNGGVLREIKPKIVKHQNYSVPIEGVLAEYPDDKYSEIDEETRKAARVLEITLEEFKISAKVTGIKKGPVITMFELLPAPGVKISKITNLADNIALRLAASRVRIVAPIPGKHAVGIEVPNKKRAIVSFSEMVSAPEMKDQDVAVPIVLGKDIRGGTQVIDLTRTPHLLIAGATGSGKSVCVNALICSILYERSPADVKMILIDPKIVELKLYNDIPHLLTPVITDPKKAIQAIQWCLYEMERRYSLLDALGVREIRSYNKRVKERNLATTELPYLILVIDEFADLMATSGKELEAMIARLAAMSRAVGIHLVLATQRPSADVITGLIKANFPSRVAFMVASMMDSRIIIDSAGAEKLLGKGDMLFTSAWDPFPSRVQGAFMSEEEVERVVAYVKTLGAPEYIDDEIFIDDDEQDEPSHAGGGTTDPLFNKALEIVASAGKASASYLQRRLKIGYNRAARLVEQMEDMGIVGPQNGSKPREVIHMPDSSNF